MKKPDEYDNEGIVFISPVQANSTPTLSCHLLHMP